MIVAYYITHADGVVSGILSRPGEAEVLIDIYEGDGSIRAFADEDEARSWLSGEGDDEDDLTDDMDDDEAESD